MSRILSSILSLILTSTCIFAQTPQPQQTPAQQTPQQGTGQDEDIVRIASQLVQTDAVITDKNDQAIPDLKLDEIKIYDNGKRQDLQFLEFVAGDAGAPRKEGTITLAGSAVEPDMERNLTASELHRVFAFVVDDLTIPYEDLVTVRKMLTDFVDNKVQEGDLVAIVRVVGGNGLVQQFTADKAILRRAISQIMPRTNPYSANSSLASGEQARANLSQAIANMGGPQAPADLNNNLDIDATEEGITKGLRAQSTLVTAGEVVNSMKLLPGRKNLILLSGGIPITESSPENISIGGVPVSVAEGQIYYSNTVALIRQLTDRASRAGVVINTMDVRGLKAQRGVARFTDPGNEASSGLLGGMTGKSGGFGRSPNMAAFDNPNDTLSSNQGLQQLADNTGGVSVVNSDNFSQGLDRVMARSSYYLLAYKPSEPFDGKFHKLEIKVSRPGAKVSMRAGYYATADTPEKGLTKEQTILRAARSPLAKRDVNLAGTLQYRFTANNNADIDINLVIDANSLNFKQEADGKYHTTFDVVGFVVNNAGKAQGGFSQTITSNFSPEEYKQAVANGISFTGHAELPSGSYQLRAVVREADTGHLGTISQYLEVPDLSKKRLTMSSVFLYGVDLAQGDKAAPIQLNSLRQLPRKLDLRYAAVIYNPKVDDGKSQLQVQLVISQGSRIVFKSPEQPVNGKVQNNQTAYVGQISLAKAHPGRYMLTLMVTDPLADKKTQTIVRSLDFNLVD